MRERERGEKERSQYIIVSVHTFKPSDSCQGNGSPNGLTATPISLHLHPTTQAPGALAIKLVGGLSAPFRWPQKATKNNPHLFFWYEKQTGCGCSCFFPYFWTPVNVDGLVRRMAGTIKFRGSCLHSAFVFRKR